MPLPPHARGQLRSTHCRVSNLLRQAARSRPIQKSPCIPRSCMLRCKYPSYPCIFEWIIDCDSTCHCKYNAFFPNIKTFTMSFNEFKWQYVDSAFSDCRGSWSGDLGRIRGCRGKFWVFWFVFLILVLVFPILVAIFAICEAKHCVMPHLNRTVLLVSN